MDAPGSAIAPAAQPATLPIIDDTGARLAIASPPRRIVALSPGATEMLFAAGAGERIVGTVQYADVPAAARQIPRIGDVVAIDLERLIALRPELVVVWPGGGNPAQIARIEKLGLPVYQQQVDRIADLPVSLRRLGAAVGTGETAGVAAQALEARLAALRRAHAGGGPGDHGPRVFVQVWSKPIFTVGGRQLISDALRVCGVRNVFDDLTELSPVVEAEAVLARDPDIILAVSAPGMAGEWLAEWRRFGSLRAVRDGALLEFENEDLVRLGPSVVGATEALCARLDTLRERLRLRAAQSRKLLN